MWTLKVNKGPFSYENIRNIFILFVFTYIIDIDFHLRNRSKL